MLFLDINHFNVLPKVLHLSRNVNVYDFKLVLKLNTS